MPTRFEISRPSNTSALFGMHVWCFRLLWAYSTCPRSPKGCLLHLASPVPTSRSVAVAYSHCFHTPNMPAPLEPLWHSRAFHLTLMQSNHPLHTPVLDVVMSFSDSPWPPLHLTLTVFCAVAAYLLEAILHSFSRCLHINTCTFPHTTLAAVRLQVLTCRS